MRLVAIAMGTAGFAVLHLVWYTRVAAYWLWEISGGIRQAGEWVEFGASEWAWTVPLHLPAGLFFYANAGALGVIFLLGGSLAAGFAAAVFLVNLVRRDGPLFGSRYWRLWLFVAGWCWIPVPSTMSWIYQWTVVY